MFNCFLTLHVSVRNGVDNFNWQDLRPKFCMIVRVDYKMGDIVIDCSGLMGMFFYVFFIGVFFLGKGLDLVCRYWRTDLLIRYSDTCVGSAQVTQFCLMLIKWYRYHTMFDMQGLAVQQSTDLKDKDTCLIDVA